MSPSENYPRCLTAGEGAMVVELGEGIDPALNGRVRALDDLLRERPFDGYLEAVPTYGSLLVLVDPSQVEYEHAEAELMALAEKADAHPSPEGRLHRVPTVYDGPDLESVAKRIGESPTTVVELHCRPEYLVYMVGFTPGFAYMASTVDALNLPRRDSPRLRVPAGSVAIAMGQTGIYPSETPGGWHLLGRAEWRTLFRPEVDPPSSFVAGDRIRFEPVATLSEYRPSSAAASRDSDVEYEAVFEVEEGGLLTSVQDIGRPGYQRYGVPVAGAMDSRSFFQANRAVGNPKDAPAVEVTLFGPTLRCLQSVVVALAGADLGATVERFDLGLWRPPIGRSFVLRPGNRLRFEAPSKFQRGARAYVAVAGGVGVQPVLGSCATYKTAGLGGHEGRPFERGDRIFRRLGASGTPGAVALHGASSVSPINETGAPVTIRVVWGPQMFEPSVRKRFASRVYRVSENSDRMGFRLEGEPIEHTGPKEIVSDGMMLGAIQVPPNGKPIVMMADRATTGGYPKIAVVALADIPKLAQIPPGGALRFQAVSRDEARSLFRQAFE